MAFEVATIKPTGPVTDGHTHIYYPEGGGFRALNVTFLGLMAWAFGMPEKRLLDSPEWTTSQRFDLEAKTDSTTDAKLRALPGEEAYTAKRRMVQAMLEDRFGLKLHSETRTLNAYDLIVDGKPKLQPSTSHGKSYWTGRTYFRGEGLTAGLIAEQLSRISGRVVVDRTGLDGRYDFRLDWTPDDAPPADSSAPSFFSALPEELGLKLVPAKEPLQVLVVDYVEQPSPN